MVNISTPCWIHSPKALHVITLYSQTSRKHAITQNAKAEWSLTGGGCLQELNHRGPYPKQRSRHIYFMEDNLLHAMSKKQHV